MRPENFQEFDEVRQEINKKNLICADIIKASEIIKDYASLLNPHLGSSDLEKLTEFLDETIIRVCEL